MTSGELLVLSAIGEWVGPPGEPRRDKRLHLARPGGTDQPSWQLVPLCQDRPLPAAGRASTVSSTTDVHQECVEQAKAHALASFGDVRRIVVLYCPLREQTMVARALLRGEGARSDVAVGPGPRAVTTSTCSLCGLAWSAHEQAARMRVLDVEDGEAGPEGVTAHDCVTVLLDDRRGPPGPPGAMGATGARGPAHDGRGES